MDKKKIKILFFISFIFLVLGLLLGNISPSFNDFGLYWADAEALFFTMVFFSASAIVLLAILYFLSDKIYKSWIRLTKWYLPIALLLIFLSSSDTSGGIVDVAPAIFGGFSRGGMALFSAGLFFTISLILIVYKSLKLRRQQSSLVN